MRPWGEYGDKMVTVSENAGFCFGVRRATDLVENLICEKGEKDIIRTFGELIHNEVYNSSLAGRGVTSVGKEEIPSLYEKAESGFNVTLILRTHGVERVVCIISTALLHRQLKRT